MTHNAETPAIPARRAFTQADGKIDFRACLAEAKRRRSEIERTGVRLSRANRWQVMDRVCDCVAYEIDAWNALPPLLRAAATSFDALYPAAKDDARTTIVAALADGRPLRASTAQPTLFEALVAQLIRDPAELDELMRAARAAVVLRAVRRAA